MNEEMLKATEELYLEMLEELSTLQPGSEEYLRQVKAIEMLGNLRIEDWKVEIDGMDKSCRRDIEKDRNRKEQEHLERQIELEELKLKRIKPDTIFTVGTLVLTNAGMLAFEATGHLVPKFAKALIDKIRIF